MKKKLEADLISIAHRILKLKSKEDVRELHLETQKLYEKLSVLLFVEENFGNAKPTIGLAEVEQKLENVFSLKNELVMDETPKKIEIPVIEIIEAKTIEAEESVEIEETPIIEIPKVDKKQILIEDLLVTTQMEPVFEKIVIEETKIPEEISKIIDDKVAQNTIENSKFIDIPEPKEYVFDKVDASNLNDKLKKSINIGLNDKIAFEKNLFGGSSEDFNRVISQISTFDNVDEAKNFITKMVKPDYNNWENQDEFANRFMEIVESKFS
ncbi:hypothetical protein [Flavobacterium sp.]|uniref:hypothetical protein n=1 Tax=Flavobacterium sp. TaxID=239 RepID=UPI00286D9096|nr:hypothetical protein [Flavobacterium sp.]